MPSVVLKRAAEDDASPEGPSKVARTEEIGDTTGNDEDTADGVLGPIEGSSHSNDGTQDASNVHNEETEQASDASHDEIDSLIGWEEHFQTRDPVLLSSAKPSWRGLDDIKHIVVFGDAFSRRDVAFNNTNIVTWVHHLVTNAGRDNNENPIFIHNFARSRDSVGSYGLERQLDQYMARFRGESQLPPLSTLYVIWMENLDMELPFGCTLPPAHTAWDDDDEDEDEDDVRTTDDIVNNLVRNLHRLSIWAHARNFLIMDVLPLDRTPAAICGRDDLDDHTELDALESRIRAWNKCLHDTVKDFTGAPDKGDSNVFLFSSWVFGMKIYFCPYEYGLEMGDQYWASTSIWADDILLSTKVHAVLAEVLGEMREEAAHQ